MTTINHGVNEMIQTEEDIYNTTVDAYGNWAIIINGGDVIADLMTREIAEKICALLNTTTYLEDTLTHEKDS